MMPRKFVAILLAVLFAMTAVGTGAGAQTYPPPGPGQPPPPSGCLDVPRNVYYTVPFDWAWQTGVTTGVGGSNFCEPLRRVTRAEALTFLWRAVGRPPSNAPHGFVDVVPGSFYEQAVRWAVANGITTGYAGSNRFEPNLTLDRGQLITFTWRIQGQPSSSVPHGFVDVPPGAYFADAVQWARANGVTTGYAGSNRFEPFIAVDRAQNVTFAYRIFGS